MRDTSPIAPHCPRTRANATARQCPIYSRERVTYGILASEFSVAVLFILLGRISGEKPHKRRDPTAKAGSLGSKGSVGVYTALAACSRSCRVNPRAVYPATGGATGTTRTASRCK
jgi:hypothetical protein